MKKLIIFDLDGTLLNTIADLAHSTNQALEKYGFPIHNINAYNFFVGNGINKLFERALPDAEKTEENILKIRECFLPYYDCHNTDYSSPYAGIANLLGTLQENGYMLAVASNKYEAATRKLVTHYFPGIDFIAILGQQESRPVKPSPEIINEIISQAQVTKEEVLYIGDSGVDMQTAINAGVTVAGVTWGFRPRTELELFKPDYIVDKAEDILFILSSLNEQ